MVGLRLQSLLGSMFTSIESPPESEKIRFLGTIGRRVGEG